MANSWKYFSTFSKAASFFSKCAIRRGQNNSPLHAVVAIEGSTKYLGVTIGQTFKKDLCIDKVAKHATRVANSTTNSCREHRNPQEESSWQRWLNLSWYTPRAQEKLPQWDRSGSRSTFWKYKKCVEQKMWKVPDVAVLEAWVSD